MPKQPSEPQIQTHNFEDFDELVENVQGWDLDLPDWTEDNSVGNYGKSSERNFDVALSLRAVDTNNGWLRLLASDPLVF